MPQAGANTACHRVLCQRAAVVTALLVPRALAVLRNMFDGGVMRLAPAWLCGQGIAPSTGGMAGAAARRAMATRATFVS